MTLGRHRLRLPRRDGARARRRRPGISPKARRPATSRCSTCCRTRTRRATTATVRYLLPFGRPPIERDYTLAADVAHDDSRSTIRARRSAHRRLGGDHRAAADHRRARDVPERAGPGRSRPGHGSAGVTAPATSWFLAEGATGPFFDLFILLANPNDAAARGRRRLSAVDGTTLTQALQRAANSRFTIWVDDEQIPAGSGSRPLANVAVSSTVTSTNGVPIIVERTMWWPGPDVTPSYWTEAHNSPGATPTGTRWALAEGEVGGAAERRDLHPDRQHVGDRRRRARHALLRGRHARRAHVRAAAEQPHERERRRPSSRRPPNGASARVIESLGATPAQIVVERAMYTSPGGVRPGPPARTRWRPG